MKAVRKVRKIYDRTFQSEQSLMTFFS